jgi:LysM repeat protein
MSLTLSESHYNVKIEPHKDYTMTNNRSILLFFMMLAGWSTVSAQFSQSPEHMKYIDEYKDIAIREMERAGIPASIKLAQGILESNAGQSYLAKRANNHFGIKCGDNWNGKTVYRKDDDYDSRGKLIESCFRSYRTVEACFVAHSEFLRDPKKTYRYGFLFQLDPTDYERWAYGLKKAGYATSATYPEKLIEIIERYQLFQYDNMSSIDLGTPGSDLIAGVIMQTNDVKYTLATPQETVSEIADRTDIALRKLIDYNEHLTDGSQVLKEGEKVYLQKKRNSYRGRQQYHTVAPGESMLDISNLYGLKLDKLYKRNRIPDGREPAVKEEIKLRGGKVKVPPSLRPPGAIIEQPEPDPVIVDNDDDFMDNDNNLPDTEEPEFPTTPLPDDDKVVTNPTPQPPVVINKPPVVTNPPVENKDDDPFINDNLPPANNQPDPLPPPVVITRPPSGNTNTPPPVVTQPEPTRPVEPQPTTPPANTATYHQVVKGDTLWNISQRYGITVDQLKQLNGLSTNTISIGQDLRVK